MIDKIIIAVDGFSSCGKSTMAKDLAKKIEYLYVDSGAIYRSITLYAMQNKILVEGELDLDKLESCINSIEIEFRLNTQSDSSETFLNGENVENIIRGMEVSEHVSLVSSYPVVRQYIDQILHSMSKSKGVVMDGRDIGTAVFPDAELKIFVTAKPEVRAQRRLDELRSKGDESVSFEEVLTNLEQRDYADQNRKESPLRRAEDAIELDNSELTIDEQMEWLLSMFYKTVGKQ